MWTKQQNRTSNGLDYSETTRGAYFNEGELRAANRFGHDDFQTGEKLWFYERWMGTIAAMIPMMENTMVLVAVGDQ